MKSYNKFYLFYLLNEGKAPDALVHHILNSTYSALQ